MHTFVKVLSVVIFATMWCFQSLCIHTSGISRIKYIIYYLKYIIYNIWHFGLSYGMTDKTIGDSIVQSGRNKVIQKTLFYLLKIIHFQGALLPSYIFKGLCFQHTCSHLSGNFSFSVFFCCCMSCSKLHWCDEWKRKHLWLPMVTLQELFFHVIFSFLGKSYCLELLLSIATYMSTFSQRFSSCIEFQWSYHVIVSLTK